MATITTQQALALKVYAETLSAFERKNIMIELIRKRSISSGKSAQFIVGGVGDDTDVATHTLGTKQSGSQMSVAERTILLERPIYVRRELDAYEEAMAHYDQRTMITSQNGGALALKIDKRIFTELDVAMGTAGVADQAGAGSVTNTAISGGADAEAKGNALVEAIFAGSAIIDGKDKGDVERVVVTTPENYYNILLSQKAVNGDWNAGDNGSISTGKVFKIGNAMILRSNNIVKTGLTNVSGTLEAWMLDKNVVGMVELMGMQTKEWFDDDYDYTVMKAQLASGFGVLDPSGLVAIKSAD